MGHEHLQKAVNTLHQVGIRQRQLARLLGINESILSKYISGDRVPSLKHAQAFEHYLNIKCNTWPAEELAEDIAED